MVTVTEPDANHGDNAKPSVKAFVVRTPKDRHQGVQYVRAQRQFADLLVKVCRETEKLNSPTERKW
jgi:hypothetical protein